MNVKQLSHLLVGVLVFLRNPEVRNERGLSQSAENAILLAGAVAVATIVITAITAYVKAKMPK
jgi:branched-subunit amino acid transport protein